MSLSLYPTEDGLNWVPQVGAWAVMTLDPLDSLVRVHLDDAEARELVALLHPKKYVVYIAREGRRLLDPNPLGKPTFVVESHVELLMQGLPDTDRSACLDSGMCIPVFPETYHPTNERLPLVTSSPIANKEFPFRNAYLAPLTASLFVRSVATQTSDGLWQLSAREQASHNFWAAQDCIKRDVWAEHGEGAFESWWEHAGMGIPPSGYAHEDDDEEEGQLVTLPPHEWRDKSLPPTPYTGMSSNVQSDCESVKPPPRRRDSTTAGSVATSDSLDPDTISLRTVSAVDGVTSYLRIPQPSRKWYNFNLSPFPVPDKLKNANFDSMVDLSSNIGPIPFESDESF
ncbi:hypothetical protein C8F01DRAFT_1166939 [Mycena amicta]|nr:hypothetical protein C8F01DRAFT_1166939 [Mycena amicta]